jgi:hypothetical protein
LDRLRDPVLQQIVSDSRLVGVSKVTNQTQTRGAKSVRSLFVVVERPEEAHDT